MGLPGQEAGKVGVLTCAPRIGDEVSAGYRNFAELLQEAEREGCVRLEYDDRRGNYRVDLIDID